jgi:hypothetical protein
MNYSLKNPVVKTYQFPTLDITFDDMDLDELDLAQSKQEELDYFRNPTSENFFKWQIALNMQITE